MKDLIPHEAIESKIYLIRGHKVMLSQHLAKLYNVETRILVQAVKRNRERFPGDFMFQLTSEETQSLRSQFEISNVSSQITGSGRGGSRYLSYAFTEQGVAMLSSVLNSKRAIQVNIAIMRAFVKLRQILSAHKELTHKLNELERKTEKHDMEIQGIFEAIRQLMAPPPEKPRRMIGFKQE
ncbi:MAG: ORF6N domain-containing protein [Candidatus Omnitrophota bacterium]|nr:ORF6N domain-containing protein [Candidatus Omnitrophota bacterium]